MPTVRAVSVAELNDPAYDVIVLVNDKRSGLPANLAVLEEAIDQFAEINPKVEKELNLIPLPKLSSSLASRLIFSPTKMLDGDVDDSRNIYEAAMAGVKKALSIEGRNILLVCGPFSSAPADAEWAKPPMPVLNAVLGAYHALYTPIEIREDLPERAHKADKFGVLGAAPHLLDVAFAIEEGRRVGRDIGGSDPERMAAPKIQAYLTKEFSNSAHVKMHVESVDKAKWPLMAAVNRAASVIERHDGRVVFLTYEGGRDANLGVDVETLYMVGKGITYDTGGADIKAGGVMAGMHRDKCGAAATAGFFKTLDLLAPPNLVVNGYMAYVRNSVGANCYVADELITARSGQRVRVGNTDAEGRMVMADLLCEAKERALQTGVENPLLFTIATLTGHVVLAYKDYTALMDNGPARGKRVSATLQAAGDAISDMAEISTVRREDFDAHKAQSEYEDVLQCNNLPSSRTPRGHQTPAAFLTLASGLHLHGRNSSQPLPYTHVDIAASGAPIHVMPTSSPLMMFTARFILPRIKLLPMFK